MEHLGIKGFNFGAAYFANHDLSAHASKKGLTESLRKFLRFYKLYAKVEMPHKMKVEDKGLASYQEFAKMVDKHAGFSKIGPSEDINKPRKYYESMGLGKIAPRNFSSYGEMKKYLQRDPIWRDFQVTLHITRGTRTWTESRSIKLLYLSIDLMEIDPTIRLILKNTCSIKTIYELTQWSRWKLLATRKFSLQNIVEIENELFLGGFGLGWNVQGIQTPQQFERLRPVIKRPKVKQSQNKKAAVVSQPKPAPLTEKGGLGGKKTLNIIPVPQKREEVYADVQQLKGTYKGVTFSEPCLECQKVFQHDLSLEKIGPQLCPSCLSQTRKGAISLSIKEGVGAGLGTKFLLERNKDDRSIYKYLGKHKGWQWLEPDFREGRNEGRDYARTNAGFTSQRANSI
jgi:hypothetical protein